MYILITVIVMEVETTVTEGESSANSVCVMVTVILEMSKKVVITISKGESSAHSVYAMITVIVVMSEKFYQG